MTLVSAFRDAALVEARKARAALGPAFKDHHVVDALIDRMKADPAGVAILESTWEELRAELLKELAS